MTTMVSRRLALFVPVLALLGGCALLPKLYKDPQVPERTQKNIVTHKMAYEVIPLQNADGKIAGVAVPKEEITASKSHVTPVVAAKARRSIWTRWWWWALILGGITYLGLWPFFIRILRKLRQRTRELVHSQHALKTVVGNVQAFKKEADDDPRRDNVEALRHHLTAQDKIAKDEVRKAKNSG